MEQKRTHIILFDGVCNLCNAAVRFVIRHDKKALFSFASLQSREGQLLLQRYSQPPDSLDSLIYIEKGKLYRQSAAALRVAKKMDGLWSLMYVFMLIPRPVRDFIYRLIANSRYRVWGKRDSCMVPAPELKGRFL